MENAGESSYKVLAGLREQFLLSPDVIYLNHGSFGACPRPVFEAYQKWQLKLEQHPVEFLDLERRLPDRMRQARAQLARYVGADTDDLVYVPNATTGLNIVARSLPLQPGDEVLTSDHEYGALDRTWRLICQKRRARFVRQAVPLPVESTDQIVTAIWSGVTEKTRVLFLSHITSPTAVNFPVAELVQMANAAGIITVVDGAHAPGHVDLDLRALAADFYAGNCHKWLMSPKGSAFLYARPDKQSLLEPLVVSWGWESDDPGPSRFVDEQEWNGTRDVAAYLSVPAAIQFRQDHNWPAVQSACHGLLREARHRVKSLTGLPALTPDGSSWYGQMATLPMPACNEKELQRTLRQQHGIEIPAIRWKGRPYLRISVQGYNSADDIDALINALAALL